MVKEVEFTTDKYCFAAWLVRAVVIRYPSTAPTLRSACTWIGSSFVCFGWIKAKDKNSSIIRWSKSKQKVGVVCGRKGRIQRNDG